MPNKKIFCTYFLINVFIPFLEFGAPPFNLMHHAATQFAYTNRVSLHIRISECMYSLYKPNPNISCGEKKVLQMPIYHPMQQAKGSLEYTLTAIQRGLCFLILKQWCIKLTEVSLFTVPHLSSLHILATPLQSSLTKYYFFFFGEAWRNFTVCAVWNVDRWMQNTYVLSQFCVKSSKFGI